MSEDFRVLIVDDDFHVAKLHAAYVDSVAGFLALPPAGSASQALQAIHSLRPDLVLLDVYLPDASGLDLLHQLDVDTMILSAASDTASLRLAFRRGALGYLLKPFTAESLSQQLRSYARYRRILAQPGNGHPGDGGTGQARPHPGGRHCLGQAPVRHRGRRAGIAGTGRAVFRGRGGHPGGRFPGHRPAVPFVAGRRRRRRHPAALRHHRAARAPLRAARPG